MAYNTLTKFGGNTMKFEESLEKAKSIAFKDYDDECKDYDEGYNATRVWNKDVFEKYIVYSLSGTPPKAYLLVFNNTKKILCRRTINAKSFETIDFEGEPSGSPSLGGQE
jgi:hypothetical protein